MKDKIVWTKKINTETFPLENLLENNFSKLNENLNDMQDHLVDIDDADIAEKFATFIAKAQLYAAYAEAVYGKIKNENEQS